MEYDENTLLFTCDVLALIIAFMVCVECVDCVKEPEFRCENCDKVYKQEGRYKAHIGVCVVGDTLGGGAAAAAAVVPAVPAVPAVVSQADFSEVLRQNREMLELMRKQQETIQLLVAQLIPGRTL